jgi:hypothetical protein
MSNVVDKFIAAMRADPNLADLAQDFANAFSALDEEACTNASAAGFYETIHWVISRPDRLLREKIEKIDELIRRKGLQSGKIREIVGWR